MYLSGHCHDPSISGWWQFLSTCPVDSSYHCICRDTTMIAWEHCRIHHDDITQCWHLCPRGIPIMVRLSRAVQATLGCGQRVILQVSGFIREIWHTDWSWLVYNAPVTSPLRLRPYHVENTSSRPITEVKQRRARLVLGWVTAWEYRVL